MMTRQGRLGDARELYLQICNNSPDDRAAWTELSAVSRQLGFLQEAEQAARHIVSRYPDDADALHVLGAALHRQRRMDEAIACYRQVLQINSDRTETRYFLANALRETGAVDVAENEYRQLLDAQPDHLHALNNLATLLTNRGRIQQAAGLLKRALKLSPESPQLLINLGRASLHAGDVSRAVAAFQQVIDLQPGMVEAHSNLLACLNYLPDIKPGEVFAAHRLWGERHTGMLQSYTSWANLPEPGRRLRIAYVSPDLCEHSVARFLEAVLTEHDHSGFEITCYADVLHADSVTTRLRLLCDRWRDTHVLTHDQLADRVRDDRIDILIDLAGHTANNRLLVFASKPAPVQVTWLGYPNTTGMQNMDYRLTDARADPPGVADTLCTETLVRLPRCFLSYHPPEDAPAVGALPMLSTGTVTFGSFNNLAKTTSAVIHIWAQILNAVPGSRLLLKSRATGDPDVRQRLQGLFAEQDVAAGQIVFLDSVPSFHGHMATYNQVDIALDTFPYNGTTTTCEALWMGVPVVTLAGQVHAARVGVSLLTDVGMEDLIARDTEDYVAVAVQLAHQSGRLTALREQLRERLHHASLCDAPGFTGNLETALRDMWVSWCREQQGSE
jgi:predicted O-linked N-acetylglucosamine transferase (SPINDLY family)